jgi:hypothetical protein
MAPKMFDGATLRRLAEVAQLQNVGRLNFSALPTLSTLLQKTYTQIVPKFDISCLFLYDLGNGKNQMRR